MINLNYLRTTLPIFTVVLGLFGAFSAHSQTTESVADASSTTDTKNPCVFEVHPEHGADEEQLIKDSLAKLAEFDECMMVKFDNASASQSAVAGGSASQGGSGVAGSATSPSTATGIESEAPSSQESSAELATSQVSSDALKNATGSITGKLDQTMPQLDSSLKEDSVAKILREAAEKETDPVRKASLLKSYQDYVNSANSRRN